jgi:hypothetical protein
MQGNGTPSGGTFTFLTASSGLTVQGPALFQNSVRESALTTPTTADTVQSYGLSQLSTAVVTSTAFSLVFDTFLPGYKKRVIQVGATTGWKIVAPAGAAFVSTEGSTMTVLTFSGKGQFVDLEAITSALIAVKGRSLAGLTITTST